MQERREESGVTRGSGVPHENAGQPVLPRLAEDRSEERTGWSPTAWRTAREQQQ